MSRNDKPIAIDQLVARVYQLHSGYWAAAQAAFEEGWASGDIQVIELSEAIAMARALTLQEEGSVILDIRARPGNRQWVDAIILSPRDYPAIYAQLHEFRALCDAYDAHPEKEEWEALTSFRGLPLSR